jgi:2',3'-cyclic-nucleotide 2'-phosphodiesterase / 3'-nucleotidase
VFNPSTLLAGSAGAGLVHLRLIETTDLHLHLMPWDYYADRPQAGIGLAGAAAAIARARAEVPNTLLFDNGDFLQGTPLGDWLAQERGLAKAQIHPAIAAMNALGYDAITLGNHEFNYGLDFLLRSLEGLACPVVSANLALALGSSPQRDRHLVPPWTILDRQVIDDQGRSHPIRIGVIGFAPPQIAIWDHHLLHNRLHTRDILESARALVPELRAAGADVVLALAHTGIGAPRHSDGMENAAVPLARLAGIDALMTGHNHLLFPSPLFDGLPDIDARAGTIAGKPAVMGGCFGAQIGLIDLALRREGGAWQVLGARSQVRPVAPPNAPTEAEAEAAVSAVVAGAHSGALAAVRRPIGRMQAPLHSYFAHLGRTEALALVAQAQAAHARAALAGTEHAGLPVLAAAAPFKAGGRMGPEGYTDVPAGPVALRHVADLYAFPNAAAAVRLTGAEVIEWLERAAAAWNRIAPGSTETPLRNPAVPGYHFEVIEPLDVLYDLTRPARYDEAGRLVDPEAHRVVRVLLDGAPLDPAAEFVMATNSYRLGGAGNYLGPEARVVMNPREAVRDVLRAHLAAGHPTAPRGRLGFVPIPGTTALYETGPGGLAHLGEIAGFRPETRGSTRSGFVRLRVDMSGAG